MASFILRIVTPVGERFSQEVERIIVRTTSGDVGILKGHINYVSPLSIGKLRITDTDKAERLAAVGGGVVKVSSAEVVILTPTFEWADEIDIDRARIAEIRAREYLESPTELHTAQVSALKLDRALNRIEIGTTKK